MTGAAWNVELSSLFRGVRWPISDFVLKSQRRREPRDSATQCLRLLRTTKVTANHVIASSIFSMEDDFFFLGFTSFVAIVRGVFDGKEGA
jgi:hypothetical protein